MSQGAVRDAWRALAKDATWGIPYVDTISHPVDETQLPDIWSTLQFDSFEDGAIGIGPVPRDHRERGSVSAIFVAHAGTDDAQVIATAEASRDAIFAWRFPLGFTLTNSGAPSDPVPAGVGAWYQVTIRTDYQYDYVQT